MVRVRLVIFDQNQLSVKKTFELEQRFFGKIFE